MSNLVEFVYELAVNNSNSTSAQVTLTPEETAVLGDQARLREAMGGHFFGPTTP